MEKLILILDIISIFIVTHRSVMLVILGLPKDVSLGVIDYICTRKGWIIQIAFLVIWFLRFFADFFDGAQDIKYEFDKGVTPFLIVLLSFFYTSYSLNRIKRTEESVEEKDIFQSRSKIISRSILIVYLVVVLQLTIKGFEISGSGLEL